MWFQFIFLRQNIGKVYVFSGMGALKVYFDLPQVFTPVFAMLELDVSIKRIVLHFLLRAILSVEIEWLLWLVSLNLTFDNS